MTDDLAFCSQLAVKTGQLLLDFYQRADLNSNYKKDRTLLTDADLAADQLISAEISKTFPNDTILSEELNTTYPANGSQTWVIDPLDGTTNFSQGVHYWGVSIAKMVGGRPDVGALYFPVFEELFTAQRGQGAFLNGDKLEISPLKSHPVSFFTCDSRIHRSYDVKLRFKSRILGSAAYNFCAIAKGSSVVGMESIPKIWDIAASWLILHEAGGCAHSLEKVPFPLVPGLDYKGISFPVIGAIDDDLLQTAISKIIRHPVGENKMDRSTC